MRLAVHSENAAPDDLAKIGAVAQRFGVSPDLLRLYEREGLLVPLKSLYGTRYFSAQDYAWIEMLLRLVRGARINLAGIRHLLALVPCWQMRQCGYPKRENCPFTQDHTRPCWVSQDCCKAYGADCYFCPVYRAAPNSEALQALLAQPDTMTSEGRTRA